jgi:nucleotide-binding universal stress UspA family protein
VTSSTLARSPQDIAAGEGTTSRPVMLLTFNVPFAEEAVRFAIEAAGDAGSELMVCDGIPLNMNPAARGPRSFGDPDALASASAAVKQAVGAGVRAEQFLFHSPRLERAALDVARERRVGLIVFGPDPARYGRWRHRRAARRVSRNAPCLVWTQ